MRAELARTEALLEARNGETDRAIEGLREAVRLAHSQGARWFELRAALPLARLWRERGESRRAAELLAPLHAGFTEGRDRKEWLEAAELLATLESEGPPPFSETQTTP